MSSTTLTQVFSDIANAIRAKGVTGTMTPLQMPTKVSSITQSSKYGVSLDGILGNVNGQGELQPPSTSFQFTSNDIVSIPDYGLYYKFYGNTALTSVNLPNLVSVGNTGLQYSFSLCSSLASVDLSHVTSAGNSGLFNAFRGCTSLITVDLSKLASVGANGLSNAFNGCSSLTTVYLSKLSSAGSNGFNYAFQNCTHLELVDFSEATAVPALSDINAFNNTNNTYSIVVPDSLYSSWIAASNWSDSTIVGHIVKASDYTPAS